MRRLRELGDDSGQAALIVALSLVVLISFLGLAVDIGHVRYEQRRLQAAADAAALASALEVRVCADTERCDTMQTAATASLTENGFTNIPLSTNCADLGGSSSIITLTAPGCSRTDDPNIGKKNFVEVRLAESVPTYFARAVGFPNFRIRARAEAARGLGGPCIYALNPSAAGAFDVVAGLGFHSNCGIIVESSSPLAATCIIGAGISAPEFRVTGGVGGLLCVPPANLTTGVPPPSPADPLAYLPAPPTANDSCGTSSGLTYNGSPTPVNLILPLLANVTFNPGVYCGGISITAALLSNITFNPGIYILRNGRGTLLGLPIGPTTSGLTITVSALSALNAQGVMFYNEGNAGSFSITASPPLLGLSTFNMTAQTSGEYGGVLFFQAHGVTNTGTFLVSLLQGSSMNGGIYMPDALVSYGVGVISGAQGYNFLVADRIQFTAQVLSTFTNDFSTLQNGSPLGGDTSVLVQ
jgi:Flp pilus assembly protein TadG